MKLLKDGYDTAQNFSCWELDFGGKGKEKFFIIYVCIFRLMSLRSSYFKILIRCLISLY